MKAIRDLLPRDDNKELVRSIQDTYYRCNAVAAVNQYLTENPEIYSQLRSSASVSVDSYISDNPEIHHLIEED